MTQPAAPLTERTVRISVTEAHRHFGDLARIRNGETHWMEVVNPEGRWVPVFEGVVLVAYELIPRDGFKVCCRE